jgi:hypothetical protein
MGFIESVAVVRLDVEIVEVCFALVVFSGMWNLSGWVRGPLLLNLGEQS